MESQDLIDLPASSNCLSGSESVDQANNTDSNDCGTKAEIPPWNAGDVGNSQNHSIVGVEIENTVADDSSNIQISDEITEAARVEEKLDDFCSGAHPTKKRGLDVQNGSPIRNHMMDASKQKLEELLQKWSEWQAENGSLSQDQNELVELGEWTCFPALRVGEEKPSTVSFWIDNQTRNPHDTEFIPLESKTVPLYDRGYAFGLTSTDGSSNLEGGLEIQGDASRCFNCGSYSHSLKQCPKPLDNVAVNTARKQHKSKRFQNAASHSAVRYYQNSQGGKYDDLKPGALGAKTRQLLGLGEFDPPPWLNRMREIGYPLGYIAPDDEDQPSGITIYADRETNEGQEDGEIAEMVNSEVPEPRKKMTVEFPGINAPIPVGADEKRWASSPSSSESFRNRSHQKLNHSSETGCKGHHHEHRYHVEFEDKGPPGVEPRFSSSYPPRYGNYDSPYSFHSSRDHFPMPQSPTSGWSHFDRGRRSHLVCEDFPSHGSYSSLYSSSDRHKYISPRIHDLGRVENQIDERLDNSYLDYSYWANGSYISSLYSSSNRDRYISPRIHGLGGFENVIDGRLDNSYLDFSYRAISHRYHSRW